jgi:flagellar biosynthetic protein FliR
LSEHIAFNAQLLLAFARCCGFVARAPGFGHPSIPSHARVLLAAGLTLAVSPALHGSPEIDGLSFIVAAITEALLGAAIGMFAAVLYDGAYAGGRLIDDYAGVRAIAPSIALVAPSGFGRIWSLAFTAGLFLFGAYVPIVLAFAQSFRILPAGHALLISHDAVYAYAVALPETIVLVGLTVAGPAIVVAFVVQIVLAALARTIPRFSTFPLATACVFASALLVTMFSVPALEHVAAHPFLHSPLTGQRR